jgi:predicted metal-dependent enzyme (double-stranded beta helix superfamily)
LVGRYWDDAPLYQVAEAFERNHDWKQLQGGAMFSIDKFVRDCVTAAKGANREASVIELIENALKRADELASAFEHMQGESDLVYADDDVTIYHERLTPNIQFPAHDHGMTAIVGVYSGEEIHTFYRRTDKGLERTGQRAIKAGEHICVQTGGIHNVLNTMDERSASIHIYLGNLTKENRSLWNPKTGEEVRFASEDYFGLAIPIEER